MHFFVSFGCFLVLLYLTNVNCRIMFFESKSRSAAPMSKSFRSLRADRRAIQKVTDVKSMYNVFIYTAINILFLEKNKSRMNLNFLYFPELATEGINPEVPKLFQFALSQ